MADSKTQLTKVNQCTRAVMLGAGATVEAERGEPFRYAVCTADGNFTFTPLDADTDNPVEVTLAMTAGDEVLAFAFRKAVAGAGATFTLGY